MKALEDFVTELQTASWVAGKKGYAEPTDDEIKARKNLLAYVRQLVDARAALKQEGSE